jgi:hypothetical protein
LAALCADGAHVTADAHARGAHHPDQRPDGPAPDATAGAPRRGVAARCVCACALVNARRARPWLRRGDGRPVGLAVQKGGCAGAAQRTVAHIQQNSLQVQPCKRNLEMCARSARKIFFSGHFLDVPWTQIFSTSGHPPCTDFLAGRTKNY